MASEMSKEICWEASEKFLKRVKTETDRERERTAPFFPQLLSSKALVI